MERSISTFAKYNIILFLLLCAPLFLLSQGYSAIQGGTYAPISTGNETYDYLDIDNVSSAISIGFPFEFYGISYTQLYASSNGFVTFDNAFNPGSGGGGTIPSVSSPNNLIAGIWTQFGGEIVIGANSSSAIFGEIEIFYETIGIAPNRTFYIGYYGMDDCYNSIEFQIQLFEGSNNIEIHTSYWDEYGCYEATQGIENASGTEAEYVLGRSADFWSASEDVVTFIPPVTIENDASVLNFVPSYCEGNQDIQALIRNAGANDITSVSVNWSWNEVVQTPVSFNGTISPGVSTFINLGQQVLTFGVSDTLKIWTSDPNGMLDPNPLNDTISRMISPAHNGTYTIGGNAPDYATFNDAVDALHNIGVCDSVIFNVRDGSYFEQININYFPGTFSNHKVIFQSESGDSTAVQLIHQATSSNTNYTVQIGTARNICFRNMTVQNSGTSYGRVFSIVEAARNIEILNNVIIGKATNSTSSLLAAIHINAMGDHYVVENNLIQNGSSAIYHSGDFNGGFYPGLVVRNNQIENFRYFGILAYETESPVFENNLFRGTTYSSETGIGLLDSRGDSMRISNNQMYLGSASRGIQISNSNFGAGAISANNVISIDGFNATRGFDINNVDSLNIIFNSVLLENDDLDATAMFIISSSNLNLLNNIFANEGNGLAFTSSSLGGSNLADYNNLYSLGEFVCRLDQGTDINYSTFSSWQSASGWEMNGFNLDPLFADSIDLHTEQYQLNKSGTPFAAVMTDFEDDLRSLTTPDIGADEFEGGPNDVVAVHLLSPSINCIASQMVTAVIQNAGSNQVANYNIDWSLNGVPQSGATINTLLDTIGGSGFDTAHIDLGSIALVIGTPYEIKIWTSSPNGATDSNPANDTLTVLYQLPMNGTYSIGPVAGDFATLMEAIARLDSFGLCGPVRLELESGAFIEQVIIPELDGLSAVNRLTITSASGDTADTKIQFDAGINANLNYLIRIDDADYITISNLSFFNDSGIRCRQIQMNGNTEHLIIDGNHFIGKPYFNIASELIYGIGKTGDLNLLVKNNQFTGGGSGVYVTGLDDHNRVSNLTIENNQFENQNVNGIYTQYVNDVVIDRNSMSRDFVNQHTPHLIYLRNGGGQTTLSNNMVTSEIATFGVHLLDMNKQNADSKTHMYNNMISTLISTYCFRFTRSYRLDFFNNSLFNQRTTGVGYAFRSSESDTLHLKNNSLYAGNVPSLVFAFETNSILSDYNNIFSGANGLISTFSAAYPNLGDWQTATGQDLNSISTDPHYFSAFDLHLFSDTLNGKGIPITGIIDDIDGDVRDLATPDIGADEIFTNAIDLAVIDMSPKMPFTHGDQDIELVLYNHGQTDVTHATIDWSVNGVAQPTFNYTHSLPSGTFDTIIIDTHNFGFNQAFDLQAWTSAPNGMMDQKTSNDTISIQNQFPAVSGTLTIAGASPHFNSVPQAQLAMRNGGILNGVTFNIRTGTFTDSLVFKGEDYFDCNTPVVFQSESGDAIDVIFENSNETAVPLELLGADGLTFNNITFRSESTTFANVVKIGGESHCNSFDGCRFEGLPTTSTSGGLSLIYSPTNFDTANVFRNNTFLNGSYGLFLQAQSFSSSEEGNQIIGNEFVDQAYRSVYCRYQKGIEINENSVQTNSANNGFIGIYLYQTSQDVAVLKNQISLSGKNGTGIYFFSLAGTSDKKGLVANNMVQIGGTNNSTGIYFSNSSHSLLAYNTVLAEGTAGLTYGMRTNFLTAGTVNIFNNNLVNTSGGVALRIDRLADVNMANHNNLFSTGSNIAYRDGTNYTDLAAWQATGFGGNSVSADPEFVGPTNLHVQSAFLNGTASPLSQVIDDIDNQSRDAAMPDIGADEFNLFSDDIGLLSINYPVQPFPVGVQTVFVKFINNGVDTLTSMKVDYTINGDTMPTYFWSGLLPSGATYDSLDIGNYDFLPDSIHEIKAWVSEPNDMTDGLAANDTVEVSGLFPGLEGIYTIGGIEPDFESIGEAVRILNLGGASGPVTFNIRDGVYLDTIHIVHFPGSDCENSVVFQSESLAPSSVTISNLGLDLYPIYLDGADGITFQYLTIETVNPSFANAVRIGGGAHCNTFYANHIQGIDIAATSANYATVYDMSGVDLGNRYQENLIQNGSYGVFLQGSGITLSETEVVQNEIKNAYYRGVYIATHNAVKVRSNYVHTNSMYNGPIGMYITSCDSAVVIEKNQILLPQGRFGLVFNDGIASASKPAQVLNNFVLVGDENNCYGMEINALRNYQVYHNNILNESTVANFSIFNTAIRVNGGLGLDIRNNVFSSASATGVAIQVHSNAAISNLDYNLYFSNSGTLGSWNSTTAADLASWQALSTTDNNSLSSNPEFVNSTDLHVGLVLLNEGGDPAVQLLDDIDGDLRGTPADIGADEFVPAASEDAGVFAFTNPKTPFADGAQSIQVAIKNFGGNALTSAQVRWLVNGIEQPSFNWSGNLSPGQCDTATIGSYSFQPFSKHDFILWTESPNAVVDSTNVNDTLFVNDLYPALSGIYTVGGVLPDFNLISQIEKALNLGGILGNVEFRFRDGTYESQLHIEDFPRISKNHSVVFESESGIASDVTLIRNFSGSNYTIYLDGPQGITFRNMILESTLGRVMDISNGSKNITIENNVLRGKQTTSSSASFALIYSGSTSEDSISILNNTLSQGSFGIYLRGSSGDREFGHRIINNVMRDQGRSGVFGLFLTDLEITMNNIDAEDQSFNIGIYLSDCDDRLRVSKNQIINEINGTGLYIERSSMPTYGLGIIDNNYIYVGGTNESKGIDDFVNQRLEYYHNSIRMTNTHERSYAMEALMQSNSLTKLENNIFSNEGGGISYYSFYATGFTTFDYNNFYTNGPDLVRAGLIYQDLTSLQTGTAKNLNSISIDPIFIEEKSYEVVQFELDGAARPLDSVLVDIEGEMRDLVTPDIGAFEFVSVPNDISVVEIVSPQTFCGLSNSEDVTLRLQNRGNISQTGFNVGYSINSSNWVIENIGSLIVPAGQTVDFTFSQREDLSSVDDYSFNAFSGLGSDSDLSNDTLSDVLVQHIPQLVNPVGNMIPEDGAIDLEKLVSFSWSPVPEATLYDIYIWPSTDPQPSVAQIKDRTQINVNYSNLNFGTLYNWQVVAKNSCNQMVSGSIQHFSIRELPDLVVDTVIAPPSAFSGSTIDVEWQVKNIGPGETQSQLWTDAVYLSFDATLNTSLDTYLGGVQNLAALDSSEAYTNFSSFTLPVGISGNYYLIVSSDRYSNLIESNNSNNWERSHSTTMISLSPTPDLKVTAIGVPNSTFSGQTIGISYTIKNIGLADVDVSSWKDRVYLSEDQVNYLGATTVGIFNSSELLQPDSSYQYFLNVDIPENIFGDYYIIVRSDVNNNVYENAAEQNNILGSDTINVILTPPADIFLNNYSYPDTVHNNELINVNYTVNNNGGSTITVPNWHDYLYLSESPIYNVNFLNFVGYLQNYGPMTAGDEYPSGRSITIPKNFSGDYYLYVHADRNNKVFEFTNESNNIYRSPEPLTILHPDLSLANVSYSDSAEAGKGYVLHWDLVNEGPGKLINRRVDYSIYMSDETILDVETAALFGTFNETLDMEINDTLSFSTDGVIPNNAEGLNYIFLVVDSDENVIEVNEDNNVGSNNAGITISLDWPDLISHSAVVPDTGIIGSTVFIPYQATNQGFKDAASATTDEMYISFSPVWDPENAILIGERAVPVLAVNDTFDVNSVYFVPPGTNSNVYYVFILSDVEDEVYEHTDEANNVHQVGSIFLKPKPPVDLIIENVSVFSDTVWSGAFAKTTWHVKNQGLAATTNSGWEDAIFISVDSLWNTDLDQEIGRISQNTSLLPQQIDTITRNLIVPNGISGERYIFPYADFLDANSDVDSTNNYNTSRAGGIAKPVYVKLSPSPDLIFSSYLSPSVVASGQPFDIEIKMKNQGDRMVSNWNHKIYLSTDETINSGDVLLSESVYEDTLLINAELTDTISVQTPTTTNGNVFIIAILDSPDKIYEHNGENNNVQIRIVEVQQPLPSDLTVQAIQIPDSVFAGKPAMVSWSTKNDGVNPANGVFREIVYFSEDNQLDVSDRVFNIIDENIYIPPGSALERSIEAKISGLSNGDFYALVQTDARDNFFESNDTNNISASADLMNISIEQLVIDSLTLDSIYNGSENYFKIDIPLSLVGENLKVTVQGDTGSIYNEVYLKFGDVPTLADFDSKYLFPFASDQILLEENLQAGPYYILLKGQSSPFINAQEVKILATIIDFELISIQPNISANTGQVTIALNGTQMDQMRTVSLYKDTSFFLLADSIYVVSSALAYATFNLEGTPEDMYTISCQRLDGKVAEIQNGFEVIENGEEPDLQILMTYPATVGRRGRPMQITVFMFNSGDNDLVDGSFTFEAPFGNLMAPTYEDLISGNTSETLNIVAENAFGPPGILSPKMGKTVEVFAFSRPHPTFVLSPK